jgi:hypothetical protein
MAGTLKRTAGPLALTAVLTTNIYNQGSALIYDEINHIHVVNKLAVAHNFTIYLGATGANAAGTELFFQQNVPANSVYDWYGRLKMLSTDFLVGGADAGVALTITIEGQQYVV